VAEGDSGNSAAELAGVLRSVLHEHFGRPVEIGEPQRMAGGSSRETWRFSVRDREDSERLLVLRRDPVGAPVSGLRFEAALLAAAARAGVPVPRVVVGGTDPSGRAFVVMEHVEGETIPRRLLRDEAYAGARSMLAAQCGDALATIHRIDPADIPGLKGGDQLEQLRELLERLGQPHPAFELAIGWLAANRPPPSAETVVHGDFRNGNLVVGPDGLRAVLDWELAHRGDPLEDLGWLCVKAWRFGSPLPVGGFGEIEDLLRAYEAASGRRVDRRALRWWQALGTLRWGVICIVQAQTHLSGALRSVELAAIGRRVCEVEWDLLDLLDGAEEPAVSPAVPPGVRSGEPSLPTEVPTSHSLRAGAPHDPPDVPELLEAVRAFLEHDVAGTAQGRARYHARVAANVLAVVARQLELGPAQAAAHAARLAGLGVGSEEQLARAIRAGQLDHRLPEVRAVVRATVADKLRVANPSYLKATAGPSYLEATAVREATAGQEITASREDDSSQHARPGADEGSGGENRLAP